MANIIRLMQLLPNNCSASTFDDHKDLAKRGGNIACEGRKVVFVWKKKRENLLFLRLIQRIICK